jgi:iron complex outermembrane receptor protein
LPPILSRAIGNSNFDSEELIAFEAGYKVQRASTLGLDVAAFYNIYDNLRSTEPGVPFLEGAKLVLPLTIANNMSGEAYGVEVASDWRPANWLRLRAAYTYFELELHRNPGTGLAASEEAEDGDPRHQLSFTAQFSIGKDIEIDASVRAIDRLSERKVAGYVTADLRFAWRPRENIELLIVGQNLTQNSHLEFVPEALATKETEVERAVYGGVKVKF